MFAIAGFLDTIILGACIWALNGYPEERPSIIGMDHAMDAMSLYGVVLIKPDRSGLIVDLTCS